MVLYAIVYYRLWKNTKTIGDLHEGPQDHIIAQMNRKNKRYTKMMICILTPLILTYVPFSILTATISSTQTADRSVHIITLFVLKNLIIINAFINPIIYSLFNRKFRRAYSNLISFGRLGNVQVAPQQIAPQQVTPRQVSPQHVTPST